MKPVIFKLLDVIKSPKRIAELVGVNVRTVYYYRKQWIEAKTQFDKIMKELNK